MSSVDPKLMELLSIAAFCSYKPTLKTSQVSGNKVRHLAVQTCQKSMG